MKMHSKRLVAFKSIAAIAVVAAGVAHAAGSDREKAAENFLQADVNSDGALTIDEFTTFIGLNADDNLGRAATVRRFGRYEMAFERLDANTDGVVTTEELDNARR